MCQHFYEKNEKLITKKVIINFIFLLGVYCPLRSDPVSTSALIWDALFNSDASSLFSHDISHDQMHCLLLHWAAQEGKLDLVQALINHGVNVDLQDKKGQTALFVAVRNNQLDIVKLLLDAGAHVDTRDNNGRTALFIVDPDQEERPCAFHIEEVIVDKSEQYRHWIPVYYPTDDKYEQVVALLLSTGASHSLRDQDGRTPLHWAAVFGREKIAHLLLKAGASIDPLDALGGSPLAEAAAQGYEKLVTFLVEAGADVNAYNEQKGQSPLACATLFGRSDIVRYLLNNGVYLQKDTFVLYAAALAGYVDIMELLLEHGANTEIQQFDGRTVLGWLASQGDLDMAELLLKYGAQAKAKDKAGQTPLDIAYAEGQSDIVDLFLRYQEQEKQAQQGFFHFLFS